MNRYLRAKLLDGGEVRPLAPQDALAVVDLLCAVRGYVHRGAGAGRAYDPDDLAARCARGEVAATVAVAPDGRIVGYAALRGRRPGGLEVAEVLLGPEGSGALTGPADARPEAGSPRPEASAPDSRGRSALEARLLAGLVAEARRLGARRLVWLAPAGDGDARRAQAALGLAPAWISLGGEPPPAGLRGAGATAPRQRETLVATVLPLEATGGVVHLPPRHEAIVRRVYEALGLEREIRTLSSAASSEGDSADDTPSARRAFTRVSDSVVVKPAAGEAAPRPAAPEDPTRPPLEVEIRGAAQAARIRVLAPGERALALVEAAIDDLDRGLIEHVEVRVPLDVAEGARLVEALEARRCFFCGVEPDVAGRDEAVLGRLLGARVDPRRIALEGDSAVGLGAGGRPVRGGALARDLLAHVVQRLPLACVETAVIALAPRPPEGERAPPEPRARADAAADARPFPPPPLEMIEFARLAGQKQLISGLAHEINNPLNVILGSTYYLRQRAREGKTDEVAARLGAIEEEVARIARVLDNVRRFAHPEGAPRARLELAGPLDAALALVAAEARAAGVEVRREVEDGLPLVRGNDAELQQALFQLLRNALDASLGGAGGEIAIEVKRDGDRVLATVRDRGRGISLEDQRRVFEPFFTTKDRGVGAGLGLPIARAIVESHDGRLRLESRPGEGTTATIDLPVARETSDAAARARAEPAAGGKAQAG